MADYFCTHCGCRHEPLAHVRHVTAREKLEKLAAWLAEDSDSDGTEGGDRRAPGPKPCQARCEAIAQGVPMIHQFKRDFFIWWGCKKLNRLVARERAKAEQYAKRRKAALKHTPKEWA